MIQNEDDDDHIPATQPVMSLLLQGVVAYVEVRSGHDNRSRGVKAQLRNLGATVMDTLTKDVTHVVFNEGMPSTYRKAKKFNCHLVSVLWIEACKEELTIVSEAGYPPIGQQIYENPCSLKNFKKMKSMQPDFDDEVDEIKTNKIRKQIQRRRPKAKAVTDTVTEALTNDTADQNTLFKEVEEKGISKRIPARRGAKKSANPKSTQKKTTLKEINSDTVKKDVSFRDGQVQEASTSPSNTENVKAVERNESQTLLQESASSSSSVIYCGQVAEAEPSKKSSKKLPKYLDHTPISRAEFMEGLSTIVRSLSDQEKEKTHEMSPWRKRVGPPVKGIKKIVTSKNLPPRRSPRCNAKSVHTHVSPRKSPRQALQMKDTIKGNMKPPASTSASAALCHRRKVTPLPTSPGDDFMLLSQEPGDMPSIDELARMKKGSIRAGDECVTLSQVIKSYNAVAKGRMESPCPGSSSTSNFAEPASFGRRSARSSAADDSFVNIEDVSHDAEVVLHSQSNCPSEAGSTASSLSTRVLINGLPQDDANKVTCSSDFLPGSEEIDLGDILNAESEGGPSSVEEHERDPSPIFVIKKPKMRRPFKKLAGKDQQPARADSSSSTSTMDVDQSSEDVCHPEEKAASGKQKRESLNPIDYLNKFFLPRFSLASKTPNNIHTGAVLVEETPEIVCAPVTNTGLVIPPTPAENIPLTEEEGIVSPTQSLTNTVISWVKKSCKVPLFASRSVKNMQPPIPEQLAIDSQETPKKEETTVSSNTRSGCEPLSKVTDQTALTPDPCTTLETAAKPRRTSRRSPRNQQVESTTKFTEPQTKMKRGMSETPSNSETSNVQAEVEPAANSATKTRKARSKVLCTVEKNEVTATGKQGADTKACVPAPPKPIPVILVQKVDEGHLSSGYESSHSQVSKASKANTETKGNIPNKSLIASTGKRKKITDLLSPIRENPKKRSEIYENDVTSVSPVTDKSQDDSDISSKTVRRKRNQSVPTIESNKRPKLNTSDPQDRPHLKTTRLSRADSKGLLEARSQSDLSMESSKLAGRKSSEEAKKRMARSLTRNHRSDTPKVIVCTFLTASEQNGIEAAGESLEGWKLEDKVTSRTTHVINSGPKRTLNMLKGMARGCWLVDQKWMLESSKAGCWLDEDKYELVQFSSAVRQCRVKRQTIGKSFRHSLFSRAGPIFVSPKTIGPPAKDVRELLELCGANLTSLQDAKIVIGEDLSMKDTLQCVQASWVLDCITKNKILPVSDATFKIK